jgi:hypothetical protein
MGAHGPIPKRSEERRRANKPETPIDAVDVAGPVEIPPANPKWHPTAKRIYESLRTSGQAKFYEPSDWSAAYLLAESLSRDLKPQVVAFDKVTSKVIRACVPLKGPSLAAYLKGFAALGVTEGDRRRMGIEIDRKPSAPKLAGVTVMDDYRGIGG